MVQSLELVLNVIEIKYKILLLYKNKKTKASHITPPVISLTQKVSY